MKKLKPTTRRQRKMRRNRPSNAPTDLNKKQEEEMRCAEMTTTEDKVVTTR
jgi:hypothetical protein